MSEEGLNFRKYVTIPLLLLFALSAVAVVPSVLATSNSYTPTTLYIGGSTLIAPIMADWTAGFNTATGGAVTVTYSPVGSTTGTKNMLADVYSAGWSDAPIPANGLASLGAGNVVTGSSASCGSACPPVTGLAGNDPLVQVIDGLASVAIFYHIPGISQPLNLTGDVIAEIFLGHITAWNDPHILTLNPGLTSAQKADLAAYPITVVHRSDGSGTSFALSSYFSVEDSNWTALGHTNSTAAANFPIGLGGDGSAGVTGDVLATNGAIGYAEVSYPIGAGLSYAAIQNAAGNFILPSSASSTAAAAADASKVAVDPEFTIVDAPGASSYPLATYTYVFIWANQDLGTSAGSTWTQGQAYDLIQFLNYIVTQGQSFATELQYSPLPPAVIQIDLGLIAQINYNGASILSTTSTAVTCNHSSVIVGKTSVSCTAQVTGSGLTGTVSWSSTGFGTFNHDGVCKPSKSGKCTIVFTTSGVSSSESIAATYSGDLNNAPSIASTTLTVTQRTSGMSLACSPSAVTAGSSATVTCTAVVSGFSPTGTVTFTQSSSNGGAVTFTASSCSLGSGTKTNARCDVTLTGTTAGKVTISAAYSGDQNNTPITKTHSVTVKA